MKIVTMNVFRKFTGDMIKYFSEKLSEIQKNLYFVE